MSFHSWLHSLRSARAPNQRQRHHGRRGSLRAASHRPNLEVLEDRSLPAFIAPVDYTVGLSADDVKVGDFNGDAVLDLAAANWYGGTVSVLLGNTNGTFQPAQTSAIGPTPSDLTVGPYPQSVAVGDFNADGKLDLAAATYDYYGDDSSDVLILLGAGDGTFAAAVPQSVSYGSSCYVASGDLNGDHKMDLVVTSNDLSGFGGASVKVLLGHGDGTFALAGTYSGNNGSDIGHLSTSVLADFDRDGNIDVAVPASRWGAGLVKIFLGNGDGALQPPSNVVTYSAASYAATNSVTVGDFDGDNRLDVATVNYDSSKSIVLGNGDGTFQPAQSIAAWGTAGDVNGDGALDLVGAGVSVFLGNGDGRFAPPITTAGSFGAPVVADFNTDGRLDAAAANWESDSLSVLINDGDWSFPPPSVSVSDVTVTEGNTGTVNATFTLTLSDASTVTVLVHYDTADITAAAGSDYTAASGDVIIPAGQTSRTFTVAVKGDRLAEPTETFAVNLSAPLNGTIGDGRGMGAILDNEPRISVGDATMKEGNGKKTTLFTFTVMLSVAYDQAVTMSFGTADGTATTSDSDYVARTGTLTFAPGETTKTITIEVKGDNKKEASEYFYLDLFGNSSNSLFAKNRGAGTILNDD
jgi:Calx-beta domain/FG-GAP-like repeat